MTKLEKVAEAAKELSNSPTIYLYERSDSMGGVDYIDTELKGIRRALAELA